MEFLFYFFIFLFGAVIGSFLNVVILRYNTGLTIGGRSFCFSCRKQLSWRDLFPVASFLYLRGKCRFCQSKISKQYFIVELLTGSVFGFIFWHLGGMNAFLETASLSLYLIGLFFLFVIFSLLIIIGVYDYKHQIIPDSFAYGFAVLAFLYSMGFVGHFGLWEFFSGPILALPFVALSVFSKGKWMGLGDAKLMLGIGWFLGLSDGFSSMVLSFWIGSVVGVFLILMGKFLRSSLFRKKITFKTEIPFAPFLIVGCGIVFFFPEVSVAILKLFY